MESNNYEVLENNNNKNNGEIGNFDLEKQDVNQEALNNKTNIGERSGERASTAETSDDLKERSSSLASKKLPFDQRAYLSSNKPKILLEVVSWKIAIAIIFLTYSIFIVASLLDFFNTYSSFLNDGNSLYAPNCTNSIMKQPENWGCSYSNNNAVIKNATGYNNQTIQNLQGYNITANQIFIGTVKNIKNVVCFNLIVKQKNFANYFEALNINERSFQLQYKVGIWSCFSSDGCGYGSDAIFVSPSHYNANPNQWQEVLNWDDYFDISLNGDLHSYDDDQGYSVVLVGNTFQNQESVPTNGLVKSYFIKVEYFNNPPLFSVYSLDNGYSTAPSVEYTFNVISRPSQVAADIVNILLFIITVSILIWFIRMITTQKARIMSQQEWVIIYFIQLMLFQNPVYMVIGWIYDPGPESVFACYLLDFIAQSGLLLLYLIFADTFRRISLDFKWFYGPKVLLVLCLLISAIVYLIFLLPGLVNYHYKDADLNHSPVEAFANWSIQLQNKVFATIVIYLSIIVIWLFLWIIRYCKTKWWLSTLPFTPTRYIQLSFRFWVFQAILVTVYFVFEYSVLILYLLEVSFSNSTSAINSFVEAAFIANIQQTQQFGKVLMLSCYAFMMAYLFQAAPERNEDSLLDRTVYAITEDERIELLKRDKLNAKRNNTDEKVVDVFCVDIAIFLRSISFQCYYDPKEIKTKSGFDGSMNLARIDFTLIDLYYGEDHELFCIIARENATDRIVVSFRGTASQRQMEDNLNYSQIEIDLEKEFLTEIDEDDGLYLTEQDALIMKNTFDTVEEIDENSDVSKKNVPYEQSPDNGLAKTIIHKAINTERALHRRVSTTIGEVTTAAVNNVPIKTARNRYKLHRGFWEAYKTVRSFVHSRLRKELKCKPSDIFFTGHSLGGALTTLAALDVSIHTIPRVNMFYQLQEWENIDINIEENNNNSSRTAEAPPPPLSKRPIFKRFRKNEYLQFPKRTFVSVSKVFMYNFGSPRVGDKAFKDFYDSKVPRSYRIVVEGDLVTTIPPPDKWGHVGSEILIDSTGSGSIIIEPSFVERWLKASTVYTSMAAHSLLVYRRGLLSVKIAAEYSHLTDRELLKETEHVKIGDRVAELTDENLTSPKEKEQNYLDLNEADLFFDEKGTIIPTSSNKRLNMIKATSIMEIVDSYEKDEKEKVEERSYELMEQQQYESLLSLGGLKQQARGGNVMKRQTATKTVYFNNL